MKTVGIFTDNFEKIDCNVLRLWTRDYRAKEHNGGRRRGETEYVDINYEGSSTRSMGVMATVHFG